MSQIVGKYLLVDDFVVGLDLVVGILLGELAGMTDILKAVLQIGQILLHLISHIGNELQDFLGLVVGLICATNTG